jgi:hypothetical protein
MRTAIDYERHNTEVRQVWEAYRRGQPLRAPMILGINPRYTAFDHPANPRRLSFAQYFGDPEGMLARQLEHLAWVRLNVPQDAEMGLPEQGWEVYVDFLNSYEAGWFGCPLHYFEGEVPDTLPLLQDEARKWSLIERGIPDPFSGGLMARNWAFYEHFKRRQEEGFTYLGKPIARITPAGLGTDGPVTVACNLRGAAEFLADLAADPEYARQLLAFITEATLARIRAYRQHLGQPLKTSGCGFADDAIQSLSLGMYEEQVLPFHRQLIAGLSEPGANSIHLCGDATRFFPFLRDALNIRCFDTGFPVDFTWMREALGPDVEIRGGPSVMFLGSASPDQVRAEVRRILGTGIAQGGRFILREGNNLPPDVGLDQLWAMYEAVREYGRY